MKILLSTLLVCTMVYHHEPWHGFGFEINLSIPTKLNSHHRTNLQLLVGGDFMSGQFWEKAPLLGTIPSSQTSYHDGSCTVHINQHLFWINADSTKKKPTKFVQPVWNMAPNLLSICNRQEGPLWGNWRCEICFQPSLCLSLGGRVGGC